MYTDNSIDAPIIEDPLCNDVLVIQESYPGNEVLGTRRRGQNHQIERRHAAVLLCGGGTRSYTGRDL